MFERTFVEDGRSFGGDALCIECARACAALEEGIVIEVEEVAGEFLVDFVLEIGALHDEGHAAERTDEFPDELCGDAPVEDERAVGGGKFFLPDFEGGEMRGFVGDLLRGAEIGFKSGA